MSIRTHIGIRGASLAMQNHPMVTFDQEQKEKLLDEVFDEYGDNPIPEYRVSQ
jgi:hypothetical protein